MNYLEYRITQITEEEAEILVAELAEIGFESFSEYDCEEKAIECYINTELLQPEPLQKFLEKISYTKQVIKQQNWNEIWESNFDPINIADRCHIRATFHPSVEMEHQIIITPKMSFGTGHHPTTHLVVEMMLAEEFDGKKGLDMGSGTAVLAVLAAQRGACAVDAIDIDEWAYENAIENVALNGVEQIVTPILGDASAINGRYDFIVANINRNILLRDFPAYTEALEERGFLIVSGILELDINAIVQRAEEFSLTPISTLKREGWAAIKFLRSLPT